MNRLFTPLAFTFFLIALSFQQISAQVITFNTQTGTGYGTPNLASGGISFVIQNTNPYPAVLNSLSYYYATAVTKDFTLWYSATSLSGPSWPVGLPTWSPIASVTGVAMAAGVQTTIFPLLSFNIPANTTYRFYLTCPSSLLYVGPPNAPTPTVFTNSGVNFMTFDAQISGQNVGYAGGTTLTPRAFPGSVSLTLLSSPCSGHPTAGVANVTPTLNPCPGTNITLSLTGSTAASGLAYQWQRASSPLGPWITLPGATTNPYLYTPPVASTTFYRCIVVCTFSGFNDTTAATAAGVVVQPWTPYSTCYCTSSMTATTLADIGQFTLGSLNNPAVTPSPQATNPAANGNFTNMMGPLPSGPPPIAVPNYITSNTYPLSIYQISSGALGAAWAKVWIDYNHNANFTDPGEEVFSSVSDATNGFNPTGSITIPPTALPNQTRMRVKLQTGGTAALGPCLNGTTGEVEDYLINISPAGPYDPTITSISTPIGSNCTDSSETFVATICNYGSNTINLASTPLYVTYTISGPLGVTTIIDTLNTGTLPAYGASCTTVTDTVNMFAGGNYIINAVVTYPTLFPVPLAITQSNDSLATPITIFNYRPIASPPFHLCQYSAIPFGQGLGVGGCSAPLDDSVTITFTIGLCNDNIGATGNGTATGAPANCADQFACNFGTGIIPSLPAGATFTQPAILEVTNLKENALVPATINTEMRLNLYKNAPTGAGLLSPGGTVGSTLPAGAVTNWTYKRNISPANLSSIFSSIAPGGVLHLGYWESNQQNISMSDIDINSPAGPSVATLTIYYQYVPPAFAWYDVPVLGTNLYTLSPFDPLTHPNSVVNNSNVPGNYRFYAACAGLPTCRVPVDMIIHPTPASFQDTMTACEYAVGANSAAFDLTSINGPVSGYNLAASVSYFGDQALLLPVQIPTNDTSSTNFIYSKVSYPSTGCYSSDSVYLKVNSVPQFTSNPLPVNPICSPNFIDAATLISPFTTTVGADTLYYSDPACTIPFINPHAIYLQDTIYIVLVTNTTPACSDTTEADIPIFPATNYIVNTDTSSSPPFTINCGNQVCSSISLTEGTTQTAFSNDCKKIATVTDVVDGVPLGIVSVCEDIDCSVQTHNGQPYVNRHYQIVPTNNDSAMVCLYYLQQDFDDFNSTANSLAWDSLYPTTNLCISKVDGGDLTTPGHTAIAIPNSAITSTYDPVTTVWSVCFPISSFSYFYCHTCNYLNPLNPLGSALAALPINLLKFTGRNVEGKSELKWTTSSEQNNSHFVVERSGDAKKFTAISNLIPTKAVNGNSNISLDYNFTDSKPLEGKNHYRLRQFDIDGHESLSRIVDIYFGNESMVTLFPNPFNYELNVEINSAEATLAHIKIMDATGRVVRNVDLTLLAGNNATKINLASLSDGVYQISINDSKGLKYSNSIYKR